MISTLVVALLAAAPLDIQPVALDCAHCSLTGTLLAQAETAPPLPGDGAPEAQPRTRAQLESRISELNNEIRSINSNWALKYILIGYAGYVVGPVGILGGGMMLLYGVLASAVGAPGGYAAVFLGVGAVAMVVGVLGVVAIIWAITSAAAEADVNRKRREGLIQERDRYERQLRDMGGGSPAAPGVHTVSAPVMLTVLRF